MPIYEYKCDGCSEVFEVFQKVSDPAPTTHSCGSTTLHRVLSNTTFVLKGTGWYATDYAKKDSGGKRRDQGEQEQRKEGESKSETGAASDPKKPADAANKSGGDKGGPSGGKTNGGGSASAA